MTREEVFALAEKAGLGFIRHASTKEIEKFEAFAAHVASAVREQDRENALAYMRMLHDSFSLASKPTKEKP